MLLDSIIIEYMVTKVTDDAITEGSLDGRSDAFSLLMQRAQQKVRRQYLINFFAIKSLPPPLCF